MKLPLKARLTGRIDLPTALPSPTSQAPVRPLLAYSGMTAKLWHKSEPHMNYARDLFNEPMFRDLLCVLNNARPQAVGAAVSDTTAAIALGRREGFDMLLGILCDLPVSPPDPTEEVPADYGASEFNLNKSL